MMTKISYGRLTICPSGLGVLFVPDPQRALGRLLAFYNLAL
jgi:hypothetical protein